jgi:hypothetical protein
MTDIVLVTADSVRRDYVDAMDFVDSHSVHTGITGAHYTRPSLASLLSANHSAAVASRAISPTIASVLSSVGYTCIGLSSSPHTDSRFGFDAGFDVYETFSEPGIRGSWAREFFSRFGPIRRIYHRFRPPHAKLSNRLPDDELISKAVERFNAQSSPRFMWLHMMGTHRPYGLGEDAVPKRIDRRALFSPGKLSADDQAVIDSKYRASLERADSVIESLHRELDSDPEFIFTSDHGDEFGEEGYYFHQPQRRRVADKLVEVPVATTLDIEPDRFSLLDLGPTLASIAGAETPTEWDGVDLTRERPTHAVTVAPWHNKASMAYTNFEKKIVSSDGAVSIQTEDRAIDVEQTEVPDDLEDQMRELGYIQ